MRPLLLLALSSLLAWPAARGAEGAFVDPLDAPARLSPRAAGAPVHALARVDDDHVVGVGPRGHILRSSDRGKTWVQQPSPVSTDLLAVHFPSARQGWAVGHDGVVLHSVDGGVSWKRVLDGRTLGAAMVAWYERKVAQGESGLSKALEEARKLAADGPDRPLMTVHFRSEREGWIAGQFNLILYTADGGATWEPWLDRTENPEGYSLHAIGAAGDDVLIVGELGLVLRLDAPSRRFQRVKTAYPGTWFGMAAAKHAVVAGGLRGSAWRSLDAGATWKPLATGVPAAINGGLFLPDGRLVLLGAQGQLLLSGDQGDSFVPLRTDAPLPGAFAAAAVEPGWLLVAGPRGVRRVALPPGRGDFR
ncbi:YCF48-related protein [Piscinibacter sp. XHJ-5]|uniref:WD40/YVTN/BNR-like repeat-containing protein n=1 Tax=Piscinibacter sp. XHJ-5 TaxID=3037797 RepID=UPI002452D0B6|nr:YCF48-related protein [Piscinibacter sp. XHJ-5]